MAFPAKATYLLLSVFGVLSAAAAARAHQFEMFLIVPHSVEAAVEGRDMRDGFMLATRERDSHADEVSDGHLGGLDVFVTVIDADKSADIVHRVRQSGIDIVAVLVSEDRRPSIKARLEGSDAAVLLPGRTPFTQGDSPAVLAFIAAFAREYVRKPTAQAAQGYNAARRIDVAVRAQGGTDDRSLLRQSFSETEGDFAR